MLSIVTQVNIRELNVVYSDSGKHQGIECCL